MTTPFNSTSTTSPPPESDNGECHLLGPFALIIQTALGALALLSLVYKRWRERPQRPVKIWAFDVSKQVFGTMLLHLANLLMSMFSAGQIQATLAKAAAQTVGAAKDANADGDAEWKPNPCSFYLLNLAIDTTLGIPILILALKVLTYGASKTPIARPPESIKSGYYGTPPRATWWLKQSMIYFLGLLSMKTCVFFIFQLCSWIVVVGDWALKWTEGNTALQIAFVMLIFPLIMNAFQYYIIDGFIKKKADEDDAVETVSQHESVDSRAGLLANADGGHGVEEEMGEGEGYKGGVKASSSEFVNRESLEEDDKPQEPVSNASGSSSTSSTIAVRDIARDVPKPAE